MSNLDSQVVGLRQRVGGCGSPTEPALDLAETLAFRARLASRMADSREALAVVEAVWACGGEEPRVAVARASVLAHFHRFDEAANAIEAARSRGASAAELRAVRAVVLHGQGKYEGALPLRMEEVEKYPNAQTLGALAVLLGDMGRTSDAEIHFDRAVREYRDASPIPLAWLHFSRGRMFFQADRLPEARAAFEKARGLLPELAANLGLLAEVHFELGNAAVAIGMLRRLAVESDDPDFAAHLARMLIAEGRADEAVAWRTRAQAGFDALMKEAPEMYADHAAEFWMAAGDDPGRALRAAVINLTARRTPHAVELFEATLANASDAPDDCRASGRSGSPLELCRTALLAAR
jgi:tetratricopeptide (TPR) repeat protein